MVKNVLEILARQICMVLRYVHQESLRLFKMWILPTKEESWLQLQLMLCHLKKKKTTKQTSKGSVKCKNGICFTRLHVFHMHVWLFFCIVKCILPVFFGKGEEMCLLNAAVFSYCNWIYLIVRIYSSFTSWNLAVYCLCSHLYLCFDDYLHCVYTTFIVWLTFLALIEIPW